jgi:hypothetical protein
MISTFHPAVSTFLRASADALLTFKVTFQVNSPFHKSFTQYALLLIILLASNTSLSI